MEQKKKVLIVFDGPHLPYSPTTLNIATALQDFGYSVKIIAPSPLLSYSNVKVINFDVVYINEKEGNNFFSKLIYIFRRITFELFSWPHDFLLLSHPARLYIKEIRKQKISLVIAVDLFALWCVQKAGYKAHFLSLELPEKGIGVFSNNYLNNIKIDSTLSAITQSDKRYQYLFKGHDLPIFILPNAPKYIDLTQTTSQRMKYNLIYCGSAMNYFGIFSLLDFLTDFKEYTLTIQGAMPSDTAKGIELFYKDLLIENRLILNNSYMNEEELVPYISSFWVGFVFYDFYRFSEIRRENYYTAPSGKLFYYFNAGIPVIGNRLEGFKMVEEKNAGILIDNLSSLKIKNALDGIEKEYDCMANNSKTLSLTYDFSQHIKPFLDFISKQ